MTNSLGGRRSIMRPSATVSRVTSSERVEADALGLRSVAGCDDLDGEPLRGCRREILRAPRDASSVARKTVDIPP